MKTHGFLIAAALIFSAQLLMAQEIILSTDNADGRYAKGDTVKVYASLSGEAPNPMMYVSVNGKKVVKNKAVELTGEKTVIYSGVFDEASIINVVASPTGDLKDHKKYQKIGLVVAAEDFKTGFSEPSDFEEYWQKQVAKMRKKKIKARLNPVELTGKLEKYADEVEAFDLMVNMPEGNPVRAYLAMPKGASKGSCAIIMLPHGAGVRSSNLASAVKWASYGAIALDINAHGIENGLDKDFYKELNDGELKGYSSREVTSRDDFYFRLMYLRMQRALDYLTTLPEWDGERVAAFGGSQGGGQSAVIAGLDSRVKLACLIVPALSDMGGKLAGHIGGWPTKYSRAIADEGMETAREVLPYFDAANFLHHYTGKLIVEGGLIDTTCAPAAVFATFSGLTDSTRRSASMRRSMSGIPA